MDAVLCDDRDWLLSEEAFSVYAACMYRPSFAVYRKRMEAYLSDPSVKIFVCASQGRRAGMLVLEQADAGAGIIGIAVAGDCRRRGIGRHMMRGAMESGGFGSIRAQTDGGAVGFYRKCGFETERIIAEYPDGPAVRYNCVLRAREEGSARKRTEMERDRPARGGEQKDPERRPGMAAARCLTMDVTFAGDPGAEAKAEQETGAKDQPSAGAR